MQNISYIYNMLFIADIHSSNNFIKLTNKYKEEKVVVLLWDIFDRWLYSHEVFQHMIELKKSLWDNLYITLWNHDIFMMFWMWLSETSDSKIARLAKTSMNEEARIVLQDIFYNQFISNWWDKTVASIERNFYKTWVLSAQQYFDDIIDFLYDNWNIYNVVNKQLAIHWGLPLLNDWSIVWIYFNNEYYEWIEYLELLNKQLKLCNPKILYRLSACDDEIWRLMYDDMLLLWKIKDKSKSSQQQNNITNFIPTWYNNTYYYGGKNVYPDNVLKHFREYLDNKWLQRVILWHWWNWSDNFHKIDNSTIKKQYNTFMRLDRSFRHWNIWFSIIDIDWKILKVSDCIIDKI